MVRLKADWLLCGDIPCFNFNSTMVRLKVTNTEFSPYVIKDFNSTMVRLKGIKSAIQGNGFAYFNSTMVRLKGTRWIVATSR